MAQRNGPTIYVSARAIESQLFLYGEVLRRKCFVYFDQIDVRQFHPGIFQGSSGSRHWSNAHDFRFYAGVRPADDSTLRFQVMTFDVILAGNHQCGGAIDDPGGVTRRNKSIFIESGPEFRQTFQRGFGSQMIVALK
jgi:hypothetical protein